IVVGNRDGTLAVRHGRSVMERLAEEWPDLHVTVKTVPNDDAGRGSGPGSRTGAVAEAADGAWLSLDPARLIAELTRGAVDVAVVQLGLLSSELPSELKLAAVTRRADQRSAVVAKGYKDLAELPAGAAVGAVSRR